MDEVGTATLSTEGDEQIVHLPEGFSLPGRELRVTRVGDGLLLRPVDFDVHDWRAKLDAYRDDSYRATKMLTHSRRVTPHERRRAFALASGQNI